MASWNRLLAYEKQLCACNCCVLSSVQLLTSLWYQWYINVLSATQFFMALSSLTSSNSLFYYHLTPPTVFPYHFLLQGFPSLPPFPRLSHFLSVSHPSLSSSWPPFALYPFSMFIPALFPSPSPHPHPHIHPLSLPTQWGWHPAVYLVYRVVMAVYFLVWIVLSGAIPYDWALEGERAKWFIYLTNWAFFILNVHLIVQVVIVSLAYSRVKARRSGAGRYITARHLNTILF